MTHPYASSVYANSFGSGYEPINMEKAGFYVLKRKIPGTEYYDAMGCYPLTIFENGVDIEKDLKNLKSHKIISLVGVTDAFFCPEQESLKKQFDHVMPFKEHFINDLGIESEYSKHHRYEVRKAQKLCKTKIIELSDYIKEWYQLYKMLIEKHSIKGIQAFTENYFSEIAKLKPITVAAFINDELVSAHIWFEYKGYVYSHLAASSEAGYKSSASYAIYDYSLKMFREKGFKSVDIGAGAGVSDSSSGLTFLKKGFGNKSIMCYIYGKIIDKEIYEKLSKGKSSSYFPEYRAP